MGGRNTRGYESIYARCTALLATKDKKLSFVPPLAFAVSFLSLSLFGLVFAVSSSFSTFPRAK
jgi:hypothetical protein